LTNNDATVREQGLNELNKILKAQENLHITELNGLLIDRVNVIDYRRSWYKELREKVEELSLYDESPTVRDISQQIQDKY
jgi:hypothetical protein